MPTVAEYKENISDRYIQDFKKELSFFEKIMVAPIFTKMKNILKSDKKIDVDSLRDLEDLGFWRKILGIKIGDKQLFEKLVNKVFTFLKEKQEKIIQAEIGGKLGELLDAIVNGKPDNSGTSGSGGGTSGSGGGTSGSGGGTSGSGGGANPEAPAAAKNPEDERQLDDLTLEEVTLADLGSYEKNGEFTPKFKPENDGRNYIEMHDGDYHEKTGDSFNGLGYYEFGFFYLGHYKNGVENGKGKMFFPNGDVYEGTFDNGYLKKGTITIESSDNSINGKYEVELNDPEIVTVYKITDADDESKKGSYLKKYWEKQADGTNKQIWKLEDSPLYGEELTFQNLTLNDLGNFEGDDFNLKIQVEKDADNKEHIKIGGVSFYDADKFGGELQYSGYKISKGSMFIRETPEGDYPKRNGKMFYSNGNMINGEFEKDDFKKGTITVETSINGIEKGEYTVESDTKGLRITSSPKGDKDGGYFRLDGSSGWEIENVPGGKTGAGKGSKASVIEDDTGIKIADSLQDLTLANLGDWEDGSFKFKTEPTKDSKNKEYIKIGDDKYYYIDSMESGLGFFINRDRIYVGDFANGKPSGEGKKFYSNGDTFVGYFDSDARKKGSYTFKNGNSFKSDDWGKKGGGDNLISGNYVFTEDGKTKSLEAYWNRTESWIEIPDWDGSGEEKRVDINTGDMI